MPSDSESSPMLPFALPVAAEPVSGVPQTGEEYLRLVRDESKKRPVVVSAKLDRSKRVRMQMESTVCPSWRFAFKQSKCIETSQTEFKSSSCSTASRQHHLELSLEQDLWKNPLPQWSRVFLDRFYALNQKIMEQRRSQSSPFDPRIRENDEVEWKRTLYPLDTSMTCLSMITKLPQGMLLTLLEYHCRWFRGLDGMDNRQAQTLFWILASLDPLMTADEIVLIRNLGKQIVQIQRKVLARIMGQEEMDRSLISRINILLTVIRCHFRQQDIRSSK